LATQRLERIEYDQRLTAGWKDEPGCPANEVFT